MYSIPYLKQKPKVLVTTLTMILYLYTNNAMLANIFVNTHINPEPLMYKLLFFLNDSRNSILLIVLFYTIFTKKINFIFLILLTLHLYIYIGINHQCNFVQFFFALKNNNPTLVNGILLIHPVLLYLSVCLLLFLHLNYKKCKNVFLWYIFTKQIINSVLINSLIALFLGCYWAQQETNWGGWWNWDPIELLALLLFFISAWLIHLNTKNSLSFYSYKNLSIITPILMLFISRYDVLNSIHSFAVSSQFLAYIELKFLSIVVIIALTFKKFKRKSYFDMTYLLLCLCIITFIEFFYWILSKYLVELNPHTNLRNVYVYTFTLFTLLFFKKKTSNSKIYIYKNVLIGKILSNFVGTFLNAKYLHALVYVVVFLIIYDINTDIFVKKQTSFNVNYFVFTLNKVWLNTNKIQQVNFNEYSQVIHKNMFISQFFSISQRFFSQNIQTNLYFNFNFVDINSYLMFFQKNLALFSIFAMQIVIWITLRKKLFIKAV